MLSVQISPETSRLWVIMKFLSLYDKTTAKQENSNNNNGNEPQQSSASTPDVGDYPSKKGESA